MNVSARASLFLIGCIGLRLSLAFFVYKLAQTSSKDFYRKLFAVVTILIGLSFVILYVGNLRQHALEAGGITWWNNLRPVHGILWLFAGAALLCPRKNIQNLAWIILVLDAMIGLGAWFKHRVL